MLATYQNQQSPIGGTPFFQTLLRKNPVFATCGNTPTIRNLEFLD